MSAANARSDDDARPVAKPQAAPQPTGDRELSDAELDGVSGGLILPIKRKPKLPVVIGPDVGPF